MAAKIAWLFPGQGSQAVGMGKELGQRSAAARAVFALADEAIGAPLSELCFVGPLSELTMTANTQPALCATSAAIVAALRERYPALPPPDCAAGHSLGEYSALTAAGALTVADAVRLCRVRGEAMQRAVPAGAGAMAAVLMLDDAVVAELCDAAATAAEVVAPANYNAPGQVVIAGHAGAVARAGELAKQRGGKVIALNVSAPFHCSLMSPARAPLGRALAEVAIAPPSFDVLANVDAEPKPDATAVREALVRQVDQPVRWQETIERMRARGVTHALELGPGKVLAGLVRRIAPDIRVLGVADEAGIERAGELF
jgi:[acyl-carrier-protein] S-malonyltransferase